MDAGGEGEAGVEAGGKGAAAVVTGVAEVETCVAIKRVGAVVN